MGKQFKVSFELLIKKFQQRHQTVIHFTLGEHGQKYGDNIPAVWMKGRSLMIVSAVSGEKEYYGPYNSDYIPTPLSTGSWHKIVISQTLVDGKVCSIIFN